MKLIDQYLKEIEKDLKAQKVKIKTEEIGVVDELRDGVAILSGLDNVSYGEVIEFESGVQGYVIDETEDAVGAIVLGDYLKIDSGQQAKAMGYTLSVPVSEQILGRVVNPLGAPLDKSSRIKADKLYPVEKVAPGVIYREGVTVPLHTGIKAIDSLVPIGRGQRELIIGDRVTGKTTIATDTIISQKGQDVICIYCSIGQKNSKVALVESLLKKFGAMDYTIIVSAGASDPASLQYLAPYSATAIGEYFMDKGRDVLVIYDDLSKHAWAYREISLILRRPAGREAYPGDIFYLHSRLLERSCRLAKKYGGGSMTALPIVETLEGDVSSYIPTNIISITDGQIFLQTDLFNSGIKPAIDVGISVSRVGGNAQAPAMKKVAGRLKLELAQYREMAAFSQFESELDEETRKFLNRGGRLTQILTQKRNQPYSLAQEVALIWSANNGYLDAIPIPELADFEAKLLLNLQTKGKSWVAELNKSKTLGEKEVAGLERIVKQVVELTK